MPRVSIIIASYNKERYISETLDSVIAQSFRDWELIVVDDFSSDNTVKKVKAKLEDVRIRLVERSENSGANVCRNMGLGMATGEYVMFLDADDLLEKDCLRKRALQAVKFPECNLLVFSMGIFKQRPGDSLGDWVPDSQQPLTDFLRHKLPWSILQPFWKRIFLLGIGGFDESFERLQDVELNTRALLSKEMNYRIVGGEPDCFYRVDEARKNFGTNQFLRRWVNSTVKYVNKFASVLEQKEKKALYGTVYETYLQISLNYRNGKINRKEFQVLEATLLKEIRVPIMGIRRVLFNFSFFYNAYCPRVPGVNRMMSKMITI